MTTTLKTCFKCGESKERTEFYKHPRMGDGRPQTATAESLAMTTANELKRIYDLYAAAGGHEELLYWLNKAIDELESFEAIRRATEAA